MLDIPKNIQNYWPNFTVTNEMLQNPTENFVVQFYSLFLANVEERCISILGWCADQVKQELDPEEVVYLKIKKIEYLFLDLNMTFSLGDIYAPTFRRTRHFIMMCLHFLIYFDNMHTNIEKQTADILGIKEETSRLVNEEEELVIEINEIAMIKGQLLQDNDKLKKSIEKVKTEKDDYLGKLSTIQRELQVQQKELDELMRNVEILQISIQKKEAIEKKLVKETITDQEYTDLQKHIMVLEAEKESLENDDLHLEEQLSNENDMLGQYSNCRNLIPSFFNIQLGQRLISNEEELIDLKKLKNDHLLKLSRQKSNYVHQKKIFEDINDAHIQSNLKYETIKKEIKEEFENISQDVFKFNEVMHISLKQRRDENQKLKSNILILENNLSKLRDHFKTEYIKICIKESNFFNDALKQIEDYNSLMC